MKTLLHTLDYHNKLWLIDLPIKMGRLVMKMNVTEFYNVLGCGKLSAFILFK